MRTLTTILYFATFIIACMGTSPVNYKARALNKPIEETAEINGSLIIVSDHIMVLVREDKKRIISTQMIAYNDSIKEVVQCSYDERIDNGCRIGLNPWISFTGKYVRNDSIQSIFIYSEVKVLDDCSTCSVISEE